MAAASKTAPGKAVAKVNPNSAFAKMLAKSKETLPQVVDSASGKTPYLGFLHNSQKDYGENMKALKTTKQSTPFIKSPEGVMKLEDNFKFIMMPDWVQVFAKPETDGSLSEVEPAEGRCPDGKKEIFFAIIIVVAGKNNQLYPCRVRAIGPKTRGFKDAASYLVSEVSSDDWATRSNDHKFTEKSGLPSAFWALHTAEMVYGKAPKDTSLGQKPYDVFSSSAEPTPPLVLQALKNAMVDENFVSGMELLISEHQSGLPEGILNA